MFMLCSSCAATLFRSSHNSRINRNYTILNNLTVGVASFSGLLVSERLIAHLNGFNKDKMAAIKRTGELYLKDQSCCLSVHN